MATGLPAMRPNRLPTPTLFGLPGIANDCGGTITVTNFAAANVDDVFVTPGNVIIDADGVYPFVPGDYVAVGRAGGEVVTEEFEFTIEACPTEPTPTPTPGVASMEVGILTPVCDGDVPYLGYEITATNIPSDATVTVTFLHPTDPTQNVVYSGLPLSNLHVAGNSATGVLWPGAVIDSAGAPIDWPGWSLVNGVWVEGDEFDWVRPSVQVLFVVNPEATVTVDYPPSSPDCDSNPPGGSVGGSTGTPSVTLPPTDAISPASTTPAGDGWRLVLLAMAGLLAAALVLTPASAVVGRKDDQQG